MISRKTINPYIEILRIFGILLLVLYHIGCMGDGRSALESKLFCLSGRGWIGTDLFLVIAGYLFYGSFLRKKDNTVFSYWKSRALRIVPRYYLFLALYLFWGIRGENLLGNNFSMPQGYWIYFVTFTANIPMALGDWSGVALEGLFAISLLVQLYFLFSLLFYRIKGNGSRLRVLLALEAIILISRFHPLLREREWFSYFFTITRLDGFILGLCLALFRETERGREVLEKNKLLLLGSSLLILMITFPLTGWLEVTHPLTSCLVFPALGLFFTFLLNFTLTLPLPSWSLYSGDFVYSLYLAKLPLIYMVKGYLNHINVSINKPYMFLFLASGLCIFWGLLLHYIHGLRRKITVSSN